MIFAPLFIGLMVTALAQGASVGHLQEIQDIAFDLAGQEVHIPASLFKRDTAAAQNTRDNPNPTPNRKPNPTPNPQPGQPGSNCASISLPARVMIQFCGCNDPMCPSCNCRANAAEAAEDDGTTK